MISLPERSDLIHIMPINRPALGEADTAHLTFNGRTGGSEHEITVLIVEDTPSVVIRKDVPLVYSETVKSVDDFVDISRRAAL